jgi:hypothetical protein
MTADPKRVISQMKACGVARVSCLPSFVGKRHGRKQRDRLSIAGHRDTAA